MQETAKGETSGPDDERAPRYAVFWETFEYAGRQYEVFGSIDDALAFQRALRGAGAFVHGISQWPAVA